MTPKFQSVASLPCCVCVPKHKGSVAHLGFFPGLLSSAGAGLLFLQHAQHFRQCGSLSFGLSLFHLLGFFLQSHTQHDKIFSNFGAVSNWGINKVSGSHPGFSGRDCYTEGDCQISILTEVKSTMEGMIKFQVSAT